jgi:hypothetical protein
VADLPRDERRADLNSSKEWPSTVFRAGLIDRLENLRGEMAEEPLVSALIDTQGKYESHQDRAKAIIKRLRAKK